MLNCAIELVTLAEALVDDVPPEVGAGSINENPLIGRTVRTACGFPCNLD